MYSSWVAVGERLRAERDARGWSTRRVGAEIGASYGFVGKVERGEQQATLELLQRWASLFGLRLDLALVSADTPRHEDLTASQRQAYAAFLDALPGLTTQEAEHLELTLRLYRSPP